MTSYLNVTPDTSFAFGSISSRSMAGRRAPSFRNYAQLPVRAELTSSAALVQLDRLKQPVSAHWRLSDCTFSASPLYEHHWVPPCGSFLKCLHAPGSRLQEGEGSAGAEAGGVIITPGTGSLWKVHEMRCSNKRFSHFRGGD